MASKRDVDGVARADRERRIAAAEADCAAALRDAVDALQHATAAAAAALQIARGADEADAGLLAQVQDLRDDVAAVLADLTGGE